MLRLINISYDIGDKKILDQVDAVFAPGKFNMILGPNGSGKSTLLKIFSGTIRGYLGTVQYDQQAITPKLLPALALFRAVLGQQPDISFPMNVEDVVMMGRYPHFNTSARAIDRAICQEVIERMRLSPFKTRNYLSLSGGEKQRVQFARVLAQIWEKPTNGYRYLFLDEPLNNLDINYQQDFLQFAKQFCNPHTVLVAIMHDINLAIQYADHVYFMKDGKLFAEGEPEKVVTEELIRNVFSVDTLLIPDPATGRKWMHFKPLDKQLML